MAFWPKLGWTLLAMFVAINYGFLTGGIIRKVMARIQGRIGPPVWQPYLDLGKNLFLRTAVSHGVMFYLGPVFRAVGGLGLLLLLPTLVGDPRFAGFGGNGDLLLVMYFIFFGSLGMALGAGEGGHPHSPIGISRGLSQMSAYELPFALAMVALAVSAGSFDLGPIIQMQQGGWQHWNLVTNPLAAVTALLALLGMNMYAPFNIVGAPQEIPVGPPTEYHGTYLGLMMLGRASFAIAKMVLYVDLFLGGAHNVFEALAKIFVVYFWTVFVGAVFPRFRTEQSVRFFLGWPTAAGVLAVVVTAVTR